MQCCALRSAPAWELSGLVPAERSRCKEGARSTPPGLALPGGGRPAGSFHLGDGGSQAVGEPGARHGKRALPGRPRWAWSASPEPGGAGRGPRPARCWWGGGSVAAPKEIRQPSSRKSGPWGSAAMQNWECRRSGRGRTGPAHTSQGGSRPSGGRVDGRWGQLQEAGVCRPAGPLRSKPSVTLGAGGSL